MILNELDNKKFSADELATIAGYSHGQAFKKPLREVDKEFDKFEGLVDVVTYIWKDEALKLLIQYSTEIDPNKKTARYMLEYLSSNRQLVAFKELLDKMLGCSNKTSVEWAKIYSIYYEWQVNFGTIRIEDVQKKIRTVRTGIDELKIYLRLLKAYTYYFKKNYHMTKEIAEEVLEEINDIENNYIKNSYSTRLSEVMAYIHLKVLDNPIEARKYADLVIEGNIGTSFNAYANFIKGYSYIFTSYEKAVGYFKESLNLYIEIKREVAIKDLKEKIEFTDVLWNKKKNGDCMYFLTNHLMSRVKNNINVTSELIQKKSEIEECFYFYIKGINESNTDFLLKSLIKFLNQGDRFLANLPKMELLNLGFNEEVLADLIDLNLS